MKFRTSALALALAIGGFATPVLAQSAGSWSVGVGAHQVNPKSGNGTLAGGALAVEVDSNIRPTITGEYFIADNLGIEVLASLPFRHDIAIDGLGIVGETRQLPPTVSLQYHFGQGKVKPFVGAGVNHTKFFSEETRGALEGTDLELKASWGLAAHAGVDFKVTQNGAIRVDARWIDIDTEVSADNVDLGTVNIDPLVYGAAYVLSF